LSLLGLGADLSHDCWQVVSDVCEQDTRELGHKGADTQVARRESGVHRVGRKEQLLLLDGSGHRDLVLDVLLGPVFDSDVPKPQRHFAAQERAPGVGSPVHDVNFCDDTDRPHALGVALPCHLQAVGGGDVLVGWEHAQNEGSWVSDVALRHVPRDKLNVVSLIRASKRNTSDTWQINES